MAKSTQTVEVVITVESNADNTAFRVDNAQGFYTREFYSPAEQVAIDVHLASLKPRLYEVYNALLGAKDRLAQWGQGGLDKAEDVTPLTGAEVNMLLRLLAALE